MPLELSSLSGRRELAAGRKDEPPGGEEEERPRRRRRLRRELEGKGRCGSARREKQRMETHEGRREEQKEKEGGAIN